MSSHPSSTHPNPRPSATGRWRKLRDVTAGDAFAGALLLAATVLALLLANSPASGWYESVRDTRLGIEWLHLDLTVGAWAADGLLAIFFFVVGLELKEEFVAGRLRDPRRAAVPIVAAIGGVVVPAAVFVVINLGTGGATLRGWAIPTATDIAFAVAVLAVAGRFLPPALRVFLLTLAIVDDLIAITIIATFYTDGVSGGPLLLAIAGLAVFALAVQRGIRSPWVLLPLAVVVWALVHASGVHATVAGVLLGFTVPVAASTRARVPAGADALGEPRYRGLAAHFAERWGRVATLVAVPVFAFFAAGVTVGGLAGLGAALTDPIALGIIAGLVVGKPVGIVGTTFLVTRHRSVALDPTLRWPDLVGTAFVAGIGFTVSLLVGELAFGATGVAEEVVKIGVLVGSLVAAVIGATILAVRGRQALRGVAP